jgi:hypothetical protein
MKKIISNYFFTLKDGLKVRKEEENIVFIFSLLIISILLSIISKNSIITTKNSDILLTTIIFTAIIIIHIVITIFLYLILNNNNIKQLKKEIFLTKKNKTINFNKYQITKFDFIIVNLFYIIEIGLILISLTIIILTYNKFIAGNIKINYIINTILSTLFIFISYYFISLLFWITSLTYKVILFANSKK